MFSVLPLSFWTEFKIGINELTWSDFTSLNSQDLGGSRRNLLCRFKFSFYSHASFSNLLCPNRILLCSPGCPWTLDLPASASQVLRLQTVVCHHAWLFPPPPSTGIWTQGLTFAGQMLFQLDHSLSPSLPTLDICNISLDVDFSIWTLTV
jgi:hypothetical protein